MSKAWWLVTGGLLGLVVLVTVFDRNGVTVFSKKGEVRRWYDGTLERLERYSGDNLVEVTEFGDDGKTVIRHDRWNYSNHQIRELHEERLEDGKMKSVNFDRDGITPIQETILTGDLVNRVSLREWRKGVLVHETRWSEDGKALISDKHYYDNGSRKDEHIIETNADDRITVWWPDGKLRKESLAKLNGTVTQKVYFEDGKTVREDRIQDEKTCTLKCFDKNGKQTQLWEIALTDESTNITVFNVDTGKVLYRQTWGRSNRRGYLDFIETQDFDPTSGKLIRRFRASKTSGALYEVDELDAEDGTVSKTTTFNNAGRVFDVTTFDKTGKETSSQRYAKGDKVPDGPDMSRVRVPQTSVDDRD